ncbi:MAG: glycosyltransferase [Sphingobacteriales bacterium]|nr:glycosyltransferase [Sphingobacteriales bacterium]
MLYYLMWQYGVVAFIKKSKLQFDIAHNLNFHNDWTPSFLWKLNKPFVWGPVGHHPLIPAQYLAPYRCSYWLKDRLTWLAKQYFWRFSCSLSRTKKTAAHILCMNSAAPKVLRLKTDYSILPSVATQDFGWKKDHEDEYFTVISAGRFVPLKGFDLSISAFAHLTAQLPREQKNKCRLLLIGSGAEDSFLKKLVKENNIEAMVSFVPWIEREELLQEFKTASVFLFPSHEGAGMVVAEALSFGLPVVCLDNEGPGEFINSECGIAVAQQKTYTDTVVALSAALQYLFENPQHRNDLRKAARQRFERFFHWDRRGEHLQKIYAAI